MKKSPDLSTASVILLAASLISYIAAIAVGALFSTVAAAIVIGFGTLLFVAAMIARSSDKKEKTDKKI